MKEEKIFVTYLARGKKQKERVIDSAKRIMPHNFESFNCLYREFGMKGEFTDDKYKKLSIKEIQERLLYKIKDSSKIIIIRGELGNLEDELLRGLLYADYVAERSKIPREYYWIVHYGKQEGRIEKKERGYIFPWRFEQNDYYQNKLLNIKKN